MAKYRINEYGKIEIDFCGVIPGEATRNKMKAVKYRWHPVKKIWWADKNGDTLAVAEDLCRETSGADAKSIHSPSPAHDKKSVKSAPRADYGLKVKIEDIVSADSTQFALWAQRLKENANVITGEVHSAHPDRSVSKVQESVWLDCFQFVQSTLSKLEPKKQEFELIFEYSLPGTVHERPDVLLLTDSRVISLEFKKKDAPQMDHNKDDVAQAIRYREWLEHHHEVTKNRHLSVKSYLVCTGKHSVAGCLRGIEILTRDNFCTVVDQELSGEALCSFSTEWLASPKTEMPDMLQAIEIMYREGRIPYIADVNKNCLDTVLHYIEDARKNKKKILILINGVPGAGKTAVGQSVVYEENKNGAANAVYLSGNGPLVEVLQYQINQVGKSKHMGENAIQGMQEFKSTYFYGNTVRTPQQAILIFDEAQRAWDANKLGKGFSEPEGLFRVGDRMFQKHTYAVLIGLYGNGQVIYTGEEAGLSLWAEALKAHEDWTVIAAEGLADELKSLGERRIVDHNVFLPISLRADFIDCSKWAEQAIGRTACSLSKAREELAKLQNTSMQIHVTRDMKKVHARAEELKTDHPDWKYGITVSTLADPHIIQSSISGLDIGFIGKDLVQFRQYGEWFSGGCVRLDKACPAYGIQGLELDCPIVVFGGDYVRRNGKWIASGLPFEKQKAKYKDPETIVENHYRVLLTRARKEMILFIPNDTTLDETCQYFLDMGMDEL